MNLADYTDSLRVSGYMGRIAAICLIVIVAVVIARAIGGRAKKPRE